MSAYNNPGTFVDGSATVPISAANLNSLKNFALEMSADKYTGNGGYPPAPKGIKGGPVSRADSAEWAFFTCSGDNIYLVHCYADAAGIDTYHAVALVTYSSAGGAAVVTMLKTATNLTIQASGVAGNIGTTQTSGGVANLYYKLEYFSEV